MGASQPRNRRPWLPNISLQCISGPLSGQVFQLTGGPAFVFGRYARSHCSLAADPATSHLHFIIDISDNRVRIADLGSTNGLMVNETQYGGKNGRPANQFVALKNGDLIVAGSSLFRLNINESTGAFARPAEKRATDGALGTKHRNAQTRRFPMPTPDERADSAQRADHDTLSVGRRRWEKTGEDGEDCFPVIPGYSIIERIGGGGRGVVFKAVKDDTGAAAAIKLLLTAKSSKQRSIEVFRREILVTKQLDHPNIVRYLGDGMSEGDPYLALEYIGGGTLDEFIADSPEGRLDLPGAVPLFIQILEAVAYMHSLSLVHRDIKPKNILLAVRRGGSIAAKLSDMGLSCRFTSRFSDELFPIISEGGTPAYMPPEQLLDGTRAMPQSDVFSAAATFYHVLTGSLLYDFAGRDQRDAILDGTVKPILQLRPDLPPGLANVISKGLAYNPDSRFANAQEMLDVLKQALA